MDSQNKDWELPSKSKPATRSPKSTKTQSTVHPFASAQERTLAVQRLNSFGKSRKEVPMSKSRVQEGWRVSQVERLIDLPKRDIQRACYDGKGGASILQPANSTWGKRLYGIDDIAVLMLVGLYKEQGYCLPEIRNLLANVHDQNGTKSELLLWKARLEEDLLEIELKLNRTLVLIAALDDNDKTAGETLEELISQQLPQDAVNLLSEFQAHGLFSITNEEAVQILEPHLDNPGIDLAIDLWGGPGTFDRLINTLWGQH